MRDALDIKKGVWMFTSKHERCLLLRVEVVGEGGTHQHHKDVARGGEEP